MKVETKSLEIIMANKLLIVSTVMALGGCTHNPEAFISYELPPMPPIPTLTDTELECLSDDVYWKVADRDRIMKGYINKLKVVYGD